MLMKRRRWPFRIPVLAACVATVVTALSSAPAYASTRQQDAAPTTATASASQQPTGPSPASRAPSAGLQKASPSGELPGCTQTSDQPEWDASYVIASSDISCLYNYPELQIEMWLNRDRWYGEQTVSGPQTDTTYNGDWVSVGLDWYCYKAGTYTYRDPANGAGEDWNGAWYYGYTSNSNRFAC